MTYHTRSRTVDEPELESNVKWVLVIVSIIFCIMYAGVVIDTYQVNECRRFGVERGLTPEQIKMACERSK